MTARQNLDPSMQLAGPFRKMLNTLQRKISEMVDGILFTHYTVPSLDHDGIHLLHAPKGMMEIFNGMFIVEVGIGGKEGWHKEHAQRTATFKLPFLQNVPLGGDGQRYNSHLPGVRKSTQQNIPESSSIDGVRSDIVSLQIAVNNVE